MSKQIARLMVFIPTLYIMFSLNRTTARHYMERGYKPVGEGWNVAGPKSGVSIGHTLGMSTTPMMPAPTHTVSTP
ncbi:hypothetical protein [Azospirillum sp. B4]|uniref:hypothetical protein n=1 Tax=Azospirillum sp. B4 TaxID=95605 RepID=UPI0011DCB504|nr:hypothetical protein [Azospirillum sp. B4]